MGITDLQYQAKYPPSLDQHIFSLVSSNKGYPNTRAIPICHILIPEEVHKKLLLSLDPLREESPEHHCIAREAHGISQQ